ncbi:MAG: hypothetical protein ACRDI2_13905 [Chloroflexota bacterium]
MPVAARARRVLYCVPGAWTDAWYDDPSAWWQWCCAFLGWTAEQWQAFYRRWRTASDRGRETMMDSTGLRFFDWQRVPGGSIRGSARAAAALMADDLARLPADFDVTLLGHSKGGSAIKHLLSAGSDNGQGAGDVVPSAEGELETVGYELPSADGEMATAGREGAKPARAILVDAPVDWLRETAGRLMGLGIEPCPFPAACGVPCVTVNNWLDPSGGRLRGMRNYQTFVWQDYLNPYPPHGMKGFLAERVLRDLGATPEEPNPQPLP